jgi:hypothetical protein
MLLKETEARRLKHSGIRIALFQWENAICDSITRFRLGVDDLFLSFFEFGLPNDLILNYSLFPPELIGLRAGRRRLRVVRLLLSPGLCSLISAIVFLFTIVL